MNNKNVLIPDDDRYTDGMMSIILKCQGCTNFNSADSKILNDINTPMPDLVLMDNQLEDGFGKDFCRGLKEDPLAWQYPVILVSGRSNFKI